jgi:D-alanyl-D-alanine carboxypeptidase
VRAACRAEILRVMTARKLVGITASTLVLLAVAATPSVAATPLKFSSARLTKTIAKGLKKAGTPGAIVGVWQGNKQLYREGVGVSDTTTKRPLNTHGYQRIGSVTKSFTTTALLQLVDRGKVGLDDPISKYVDGVPDGGDITLRQLSLMRSGIYSYTSSLIPVVLSTYPEHQWTTEEVLGIAFGHAPLFAPGAEFDYSNTNTYLLGLVIEKVTGQPLETYFKRNIYKPLRLKHTLLPAGAEFPSPHAHGYTNWTPDGLTDPETGPFLDATDWNPSWGWAAGGMISTLDDLHTVMVAQAKGTLLKPATQRLRLRSFMTAPGEGGSTYSLNYQNYGGWIGHDGNLSGYITFPFYLPAEDTTLVVMYNSNANALGEIALLRDITRIITPKHLWPIPPPE